MSSLVNRDTPPRTSPTPSSLRTALTVAQAFLFGSAVVLLVLGAIIWTGHADELIPVHVLVGFVLVLSLWTIAAIAARAGVSRAVVAGAVAWSVVAPVLGATQDALVTGAAHWTIQLLHLMIGMGVVAWGRLLITRTGRMPE